MKLLCEGKGDGNRYSVEVYDDSGWIVIRRKSASGLIEWFHASDELIPEGYEIKRNKTLDEGGL